MSDGRPATESLLELRQVETFYGAIQALHGVSISVREGEIVTLIGANGAGKSTTLMSICGIVPPRTGRIFLEGRDITGMPPEVSWLGSGNVEILGLRVPVSLIIVIITFAIAWFFLQQMRTGRHIYALGGNPQAARVSGIGVDRTLVIAYALCGFMAGFAGLLLAGRTNSGFPNAGEGDELVAISAVIIGGASFFGGRGTVLGVFAGVLVIGMLRNLLNLSNVQVFWQQVLIGVVIIAVVAFDVLRRRLAASA